MSLVLFFLAFPLVSFEWFDHHWPWLWTPIILGLGLIFLLAKTRQATAALTAASYYIKTNKPDQRASTWGRAGLWGGAALGALIGVSGGAAIGEAIGREIANMIGKKQSNDYLNQSISVFETFSKKTVVQLTSNAILLFAVILWVLYLKQKPDDFFFLGVTKTVWVAILLFLMVFSTVVYVALDTVLLIVSVVKYFVSSTERLEWVFPITRGVWSYTWQEIVLNWYYYPVSVWAIVFGMVGLIAVMIAMGVNSKR